MEPKKCYVRPRARIQEHNVFWGPRVEASPQDLAAVEILRPIFLLNLQPELIPMAARITTSAQGHSSGWLKVLLYPGSPMRGERELSAGNWYFISHIPHGVEIAIDLLTLSPDGKVRIAAAKSFVVPEEEKVWLIVLRIGEVQSGDWNSRYQTVAH